MSEVKAKRGDMVRCLVTEMDVTYGRIYVVEVASEKGAVLVEDDVGDKWWLDPGEYELAIAISPNDTVRLKSGEPFTTGSYTALVDSVTEDKVILKHGSWLPVDAVEKVEALTVEVGKTYEAANGERVSISEKLGGGLIREYGDRFVWERDGSCRYAAGCMTGPWRLLREVPAAEPAAETKPSDLEPLVLTISVDTSSLQADLADQFQRIADALRAA